MTTQKNISFSQSIKSLFIHWNVFSGTCSRKEFWYGQIFLLFIFCFIGFVVEFLKLMGGLSNAPTWFIILLIIILTISQLFLGTLYWTQFVRRYHDVGLNGQFFWLNIFSNVFIGLGDKITNSTHIIFDIVGFSLFVACYIIASLPSDYKKHIRHKK